MDRIKSVIEVVVLCLICASIMSVFSVTSVSASGEQGGYALMYKHILWITLSLVGFFIARHIDYYYLKQHSTILFAISILLLILVLIPGIGTKVNGARRWIRMGMFGFQPSEIMKITLFVFIADFLSKRQAKLHCFFSGFLPPVALIGGCLALIVMEPDIGTTLLIGTVSTIMLLVSGIRLYHAVPAFLVTMPFAGYIVYSKFDHVKIRLVGFLFPELDPQGSCYQLNQSLIALGSGGLFGNGIGNSIQKLYFLPASSNDFIFSIIGEEFGFLGCSLIILLFGVFLYCGIKIALNCSELFGMLLALALTLCITLEASIHIGVATGCLPTKGLSLPFISTGGSALFISIIQAGILVNIARSNELRSKTLGAEKIYEHT